MRNILIAVVTVVFLGACGTAPPPKRDVPTLSTAKKATANLASASGSLVSGKVSLVPLAQGGVRITGVVGGFQANSAHGFHVHEKGDCSAVDASSAGAHFNPFEDKHGKTGGASHHAGDIDNIVADAEGVARVNLQVAGVTLGGGAINDIAGRALVVHAAADDYASQPAGNAGARVACGVIKATQQ